MNLKSFTYLDQVDFGLHIDIYVDEQTAQVSDKYIVLSWKKLNKLNLNKQQIFINKWQGKYVHVSSPKSIVWKVVEITLKLTGLLSENLVYSVVSS